jgi:hypothetical protein
MKKLLSIIVISLFIFSCEDVSEEELAGTLSVNKPACRN